MEGTGRGRSGARDVKGGDSLSFLLLRRRTQMMKKSTRLRMRRIRKAPRAALVARLPFVRALLD